MISVLTYMTPSTPLPHPSTHALIKYSTGHLKDKIIAFPSLTPSQVANYFQPVLQGQLHLSFLVFCVLPKSVSFCQHGGQGLRLIFALDNESFVTAVCLLEHHQKKKIILRALCLISLLI